MKKSRNSEPEKYAALFQEFKNLESQLKSLPNSGPRTRRRDSSGAKHILQTCLLLPASPRSLMSSLQNERSSPRSSPPRLTKSDHDRRATGNLRGRRLFREETSSTVTFDHSYSVSGPVEEGAGEEEETAVKEDAESGRGCKASKGRGCVVVMAWVGFVFILVLVFMSYNGVFLEESEVFLVPT